MLPFGLRSAQRIFTAVADALEWVARQWGVSEINHYLDDFITLGPHATTDCQNIIIQTCTDLGISLALEKLEGPMMCLTFLSIETNTLDGTRRLPQDKFDHLQQTLQLWSRCRSCTRLELESLIGLLQHACRVVRPGRSFLCQLIDLLRSPHRPHYHIHLNCQSWADIQWWRVFACHWNGIAPFPATSKPGFEITSDASGHGGVALGQALTGSSFNGRRRQRTVTLPSRSWWQSCWPVQCGVTDGRGDRWAGSQVTCRCDNQAVVQIISSCSCRDQSLMHLL